MPSKSIRQALNEALRQEMKRDPRVVIIGEDVAGARLRGALAEIAGIESVLVCDPSRPTTRKVRFVSEHFSTHMLRADWEQAAPASTEIELKLIEAILPQLPRADIVLLSDYAKGVLTARVIRNVIDAVRKLGKRVIVDPKSLNWAIYRGASLLTPNRKEFAEATRSRADTVESIVEAAQDVMRLAGRLVGLAGVTGLEYRDERCPRCVTGQVRDERYHVPLTVERAGHAWEVDLTLWLHDPHLNVTRWHEELRERITSEQRRAVLRIKDEWHRRPEYPGEVGGLDVYTAVLEGGVRTPGEFATWLERRARA